jgi:hypothetical protein
MAIPGDGIDQLNGRFREKNDGSGSARALPVATWPSAQASVPCDLSFAIRFRLSAIEYWLFYMRG